MIDTSKVGNLSTPLPPTLSVIVPVLNEAPTIAPLLLMLARQEGCAFEVILCDGGSSDGTIARDNGFVGPLPFDLTLITAPRGRGRQMNAGAAAARGEWLLFLHADSLLPDTTALRTGLAILKETVQCAGHHRVAGRFTLRFDTGDNETPLGYAFCQGKARLDRSGCVLGDQGLLLSRVLFESVGPFDETLPVAEDLLLAERIRSCGTILLFPAEILTSPRRFETEGYRARQTLNALIRGLIAAGRPRFLDPLSGIYLRQERSRPLELEPFFREIAAMIALLPLRERLVFWYRIGAYVQANAWQLAYILDLRLNCRQRGKEGEGETPLLEWYDRYLHRMTDHWLGKIVTAALVRLWFSLAQRRPWLREGKRRLKKGPADERRPV